MKKNAKKFVHVKKKQYLCAKFQCVVMKKVLKKCFVRVVVAFFVAASVGTFCALALVGCNVTRTITTQSQYYQKGDTTCTIITKTIETYDASKK